MKFIFGSLFLIVAISPYSTPKALMSKGVNATINLKEYLQQRANLALDNSNATQCFDLYLPLLQDEANQWSTDYNNCLSVATAQRSTLNANTGTIKANLILAANDVVDFIEKCTNSAESLEFFNCFASFSSNEIATVYTISYNASQDASNLTHQLNNIDVDLYECTNNTEHNYILSAAQVYDALDYCLENGPPSVQ